MAKKKELPQKGFDDKTKSMFSALQGLCDGHACELDAASGLWTVKEGEATREAWEASATKLFGKDGFDFNLNDSAVKEMGADVFEGENKTQAIADFAINAVADGIAFKQFNRAQQQRGQQEQKSDEEAKRKEATDEVFKKDASFTEILRKNHEADKAESKRKRGVFFANMRNLLIYSAYSRPMVMAQQTGVPMQQQMVMPVMPMQSLQQQVAAPTTQQQQVPDLSFANKLIPAMAIVKGRSVTFDQKTGWSISEQQATPEEWKKSIGLLAGTNSDLYKNADSIMSEYKDSATGRMRDMSNQVTHILDNAQYPDVRTAVIARTVSFTIRKVNEVSEKKEASKTLTASQQDKSAETTAPKKEITQQNPSAPQKEAAQQNSTVPQADSAAPQQTSPENQPSSAENVVKPGISSAQPTEGTGAKKDGSDLTVKAAGIAGAAVGATKAAGTDFTKVFENFSENTVPQPQAGLEL